MIKSFTLQSGNSLANPNNWSSGTVPGPSDIAVVDSAPNVPAGQTLSLIGALSTGEVDFLDFIALTNVSIAVTNEFSVAGSTHFVSGSITVNNGAAGNFDVGGSHGGGSFTQDAGTVNVATGLLVGLSGGGSQYILNAGSAAANFETIGGAFAGAFQQNGGTNTISNALTIDKAGAYTLTGGALSTGLETLGDNLSGAMSQSGGSNSLAGTLTLGNAAGASGTYLMSAGSLNVGANEVIAFSGQGHFDQGGGTNAVTGGVVIGVNQSASGDYILHDGASLQAASLTVGAAGTGSLTVQNTATSISGRIKVGGQANAHGNLQVSGATAALSTVGSNPRDSSGTAILGIDGAAQVNVQSGGLFQANFMTFGANAAGHATTDVTGSGSTLRALNQLVLGNAGSSLARVEAGGTLTANGNIILGGSAGGQSALDVEGGGTVQAPALIIAAAIGSSGAMAVNGGTVSTNVLAVGNGGRGALALTAGTVNVTGDVFVGGGEGGFAGGTGVVMQSGGTMSILANLYVGLAGIGAYSLQNHAALHFKNDLFLNAGNVSGNGSLNADVGKIALLGGSIEASGGTLTVNSGVQANGGSFVIDSNSTLELAGNVGGPITMASAAGSTNTTLLVDTGHSLTARGSLNQIAATNIVDNGSIEVASHDWLVLQGAISGNGTLQIDPGAVLEINGAIQGNGQLLFGASFVVSTVLQIDSNTTPVTVNGLPVLNGNDLITGFTNGDVIDLTFLNAGRAATMLTGAHQNVLEVDGNNGTVYLQFNPLTDYSHSQFAVQDDGHGGTKVYLVGSVPDTFTFNFRLTDARITFSGVNVIVDGPDGSHMLLNGFVNYQFADGTVHEKSSSDPLVDPLFYYAQNHDVWNAHLDATTHYHSYGWHEGRDPDVFFSTSSYLSLNPSVKAAGTDPLVQFEQGGWTASNPSLNFDGTAYLRANPDVAAGGVDPLVHFLQFGGAEGRLAIAPTTLVAPNGFDYVYYLQNNPDVAAAHVDPFTHYETIGWKEGRNPNGYFDTNGYIAHNPDVAATGINPLDHYDQNGWKEGRDPSPRFDTNAYLAAYPDAAAAHVDPLLHFLQYGINEGRTGHGDGLWT